MAIDEARGAGGGAVLDVGSGQGCSHGCLANPALLSDWCCVGSCAGLSAFALKSFTLHLGSWPPWCLL